MSLHDQIKFADGVKEGKEIADAMKKINAEIDNGLWRLGEIAANLGTEYGKHTLTRFGEQVGMYDKKELKKIVATYLAYREWRIPIAARPSFWLCYELNDHPDRFAILERS